MSWSSFSNLVAVWLCAISLALAGCYDDDEKSLGDDGGPTDPMDTSADTEDTTDTDSQSDDSFCEIPFAFDDSEVIPPDGATVTDDYNPLLFQLRAPVAMEGCEGDFEIEVSISAESPIWGNVFQGNVAQGDLVTGYLDTTGTADGYVIQASFSLGEAGTDVGIGFNRKFYYGGPGDPVEVTSCLVFASSAGTQISIQCGGLAPGGMPSLAGGWSLFGGPEGATMDSDAVISSADAMEAGEVGWYDYAVTASDSLNSSATYDFSVPVDLHAASMEFTDIVLVPTPTGANSVSKSIFDHRALLPESAADLVAEACGGSFDPASKPATSSDEPYVVELDVGCAQDTISSLPAEERAALYFYPVWTETAVEKISVGLYFDEFYFEWSNARIEYRSNLD